MKSLNNYIREKLVINKDLVGVNLYNFKSHEWYTTIGGFKTDSDKPYEEFKNFIESKRSNLTVSSKNVMTLLDDGTYLYGVFEKEDKDNKDKHIWLYCKNNNKTEIIKVRYSNKFNRTFFTCINEINIAILNVNINDKWEYHIIDKRIYNEVKDLYKNLFNELK